MSVLGSTEFDATDTVVVDVSERLSAPKLRAISWPHGDDTVGPACLPCLPPQRVREEPLSEPADAASTSALESAHDLDEDDLVPFSWLERLDARLEEWPPLAVWALLYAMLGACALCAALIALILCLRSF